MANLYNGFNALALGQAINNMHGGLANRKITGLQMLGESMKDALQAREDAEKDAARKKSALEYLVGNGYDQQKAEQIVNTVDPSDAVKYLQGRLDKKADTADEREYEEKIYGRNRKDRLADIAEQREYDELDREKQWAHDFEDFVTKSGITYGQAVRQMQFGQLMQQLGLISSKDWGDSRQGVDQYNDTISALKTFSEKNPEFLDVLGLINTNLSGGKGDGYFFEDKIKKLIENGSKDITDAQREAILEDLENHGEFSNIIGDPRYTDAIAKFTANVDNKKLMPYIRLQKLIGRNTTQTQRNKQIDKANFAERINSLYNAIINAARGKGEFPKLNDNELKALKEKFGKNQKYLTRYTRG